MRAWVGQAVQQDRWIVGLLLLLGIGRVVINALSWPPGLGFDGDTYVTAAMRLVNGQPFDFFAGTLTYSWLIAFWSSLFNSVNGILLFQWALSVAAGIALYFALKPYSSLVAALAACLIALDPQLGYLHNYVSTDGFYASMQILAFSAFLGHMPPREPPRFWGSSIGLGFFLGIAFMARTAGLLGIIPAAILYFAALRSWKCMGLLIAGYGLAVLALAGLLYVHTGSFAIDVRHDLSSMTGFAVLASAVLVVLVLIGSGLYTLIRRRWGRKRARQAIIGYAVLVLVAGAALIASAESLTGGQVSARAFFSTWVTPERVRYFANFFVFSGQYTGGTTQLFEVEQPFWHFAVLPTLPGLAQFSSWFTLAWDAISSSWWLFGGLLAVVFAPRAALRWPILFGVLMFVYHAAITVVFNKVIPRYVTVVSFYREVAFAFVLAFAIQGYLAWRQRAQSDVRSTGE